MKANLNKEEVLEALQKVQNVVGSKTTLPILLNTLVEASAELGGLRFTSTDMDLSVRAVVPCRVDEDGKAALPAKRLFSIFRELPGSEIRFEIEDSRKATIVAGKARFVLMGMNPDEFPEFPKVEDDVEIVLPQKQLGEMLHKTSYASSTDETRQALNGILFKLVDGQMTLAATDGRRLALIHAPLEEVGDKTFEVIIPTKAIREIERMLDGKGDVRLGIASNQASFGFLPSEGGEPHTVLVTRLIDGTFPNYDQVIPSSSRVKALIPREAFLEAVRRISLLVSDKASSIRLAFRKDSLEISANTPEVGEAEETLEVEYGGEDLDVGFNPTYLMDPLRNLDCDTVSLELTDALSPGVIRSPEPFLYVLMPMRL